MIVFEIPFEPHAKRAPVAAHNPKTKIPIIRDPDFERKRDIAAWIADNYKLPNKPLAGPLEIDMLFKVPLPLSISNRERERRLSLLWAFDNKKDCDNMQKLYQDILNFGPLKGRVFHDDHFVCRAITQKIWAETPGVLICLKEITTPFCLGL